MPNVSQELLQFNFSLQSQPVRVELIDNETWFAAKDVCKILQIENSRDAISRLENDEKGVVTTDTPGGAQKLQFVNESGLYNLIFQSRKPEARKFRKWVTSEVLPSIRKTGKYCRPTIDNLLTNESLINLLNYCDKTEHNGELFYAAVQVRKLFGKERSGGLMQLFDQMLKSGQAIKHPPGHTNAKWWVKRSALPRLLNIKPTSLVNISIIKSLKGGML